MHGLDAFGDYMDLQSRMRAGMRLLSVRERAFATITVDVLYQTLRESCAVVRFAAQFGMTKA